MVTVVDGGGGACDAVQIPQAQTIAYSIAKLATM